MTDSIKFIIDSSKRLDGTSSNFTYKLQIPKTFQYTHACVLQAIIPKSYYLVAAGYNTFILSENSVETIVTVTPGNYNVVSWQTIISALLTASSSQGWTYSITFPNSQTQVDTGMFTHTVTGNASQPSIIFPAASNLYEQFGFNANSINTFANGTLTSANVVKFQQEDTIYIHTDLISVNTMDDKTDVLQEILASSTPTYSNIIYTLPGSVEGCSRKLSTSAGNNVYRFSLTDENNNVLNLNGLNCVFTIVMYQKDMINTVIANDILTNSH
jgi:hypothetical protein